MKSNLSFLSFMIHTFCVFLKKYLPIPKLQRFSLVFFQKFYDFRFHIEVYNSLSVHFCLWCKEWVKVVFTFLAFGCPVVLAAFVRIGYLLSVELTQHLCKKSIDYTCVYLFLDSIYLSLSLSFCQYHTALITLNLQKS